MTKPYLTAKCVRATLDDEGVVVVLELTEGKNSASFEIVLGPEYDPPSVGSEFAVTLPVRRRRGAK